MGVAGTLQHNRAHLAGVRHGRGRDRLATGPLGEARGKLPRNGDAARVRGAYLSAVIKLAPRHDPSGAARLLLSGLDLEG
jgi:hypothetical protein